MTKALPSNGDVIKILKEQLGKLERLLTTSFAIMGLALANNSPSEILTLETQPGNTAKKMKGPDNNWRGNSAEKLARENLTS